jgi:hypothetical protein
MKSYRDLWLWLGAALLTASAGLLAIALAYFTRSQSYSLFTSRWLLAATIIFLLAFACFYSAIKGIAFPPWEKPGFPEIEVVIYGSAQADISRTATDSPAQLFIWFYRVHIINREKEQNASLIIRPYFDLAPGGPDPFTETASSYANSEQLQIFLSPRPAILSPRILCLRPFPCLPRLALQATSSI